MFHKTYKLTLCTQTDETGSKEGGILNKLASWSFIHYCATIRDNYKAFLVILLCDAVFFGLLVLVNTMLQPYASWLALQEATTMIQAQAFSISMLTLAVQVVMYSAAKNLVSNRLVSLSQERPLGLFSFKRFIGLNLLLAALLWFIVTVAIIAVAQVAPVEGTTAYTVMSFVFVFISVFFGMGVFVFGQLIHGAFSHNPAAPFKELLSNAFTELYEHMGAYLRRFFSAGFVVGIFCGLFALFGLAVKTNYRNHPLSLNQFTPTYTMIFTIGLVVVLYVALSYLRHEFFKMGHKA